MIFVRDDDTCEPSQKISKAVEKQISNGKSVHASITGIWSTNELKQSTNYKKYDSQLKCVTPKRIEPDALRLFFDDFVDDLNDDYEELNNKKNAFARIVLNIKSSD